MKHLYTLLFSIFLIPFYGSAQSNYKAGYVVTSIGDTVRGFINYKEWEYAPSRIEFKADINAAAKTEYTIENAAAFAVAGLESFRRFTLPVSQDQVEYSNLSQGIDTSTVTKTAFFKIIASGKYITLYSYSDKIKHRFFIAENMQQLAELRYHVYIDPDGLNHVTTDAGYKKQLLKLAAEYQSSAPGLYTEIQGADYKYGDIVKVINRINGLSGLSEEQKSMAKPSAVFFVTAGINSSTVKLSGIENLNNIPPSSSIFPQIGAGMNLYINKEVGKLIFRPEVYFTGSSSNFNFSYNPDPDASIVSYTERMSYKLYRASVVPQLLYNIYNGQQLKFFLAAGINVQLCFYSDKQYTITTHFSGTSSNNDDTEPGLFPFTYGVNFNVIGKAGVMINNRVEIYAAYVPSTELIRDSYDMTLTQYSFGLSYLFDKGY
jgi:hypothetical protein